MVAVILSRLVTSIREVLSFNSITLWCDSAVVLHWLNNPASKFKPFVSTRVQEIQETLSNFSNCFRYIRSCDNPADFLTKPIIFDKLSAWHEGPSFLKNPKNVYECKTSFTEDVAQISKQEEKTRSYKLHCLSATDSFIEKLLLKISTWPKLLRIVAWLRRPLLHRSQRRTNLSGNELKNAKLTLFWLVQEDFRLPHQQTLRKKLNLDVSEDDRLGLLRIHGRFSNCPWKSYVMNPIPLPGSNKRLLEQQMGHLLKFRFYFTNFVFWRRKKNFEMEIKINLHYAVMKHFPI